MKKTAIFKNSIRKLLTAFLVVCLLITSGLFTVPVLVLAATSEGNKGTVCKIAIVN